MIHQVSGEAIWPILINFAWTMWYISTYHINFIDIAHHITKMEFFRKAVPSRIKVICVLSPGYLFRFIAYLKLWLHCKSPNLLKTSHTDKLIILLN